MMKALHLNTYADTGGAAKAALRICQSLRGINCNASMIVAASQTKETYIFSNKNLLNSVKYSLFNKFSKIFIKLSGFRTKIRIVHSLSLFSYCSGTFFQWIALNLLSIKENPAATHFTGSTS
ncbi:hypothetical protein [Thermosynechococcus sp. FA-CM-4201]